MSLDNCTTRLSQIGIRAARLCYADGCPADNICVGSCAVVVPASKYLTAAAEEIFAEYWSPERLAKYNVHE